jgi:hypothetical protein
MNQRVRHARDCTALRARRVHGRAAIAAPVREVVASAVRYVADGRDVPGDHLAVKAALLRRLALHEHRGVCNVKTKTEPEGAGHTGVG